MTLDTIYVFSYFENMIGRDYKPNYVGSYSHVYNRGVNKSLIFLDEQDYSNFIYRAKILLGIIPPPKRSAKGGIRLKALPFNSMEILSYCLMPNHFHFLIKQNLVNSQKTFLHRLCTSYSTYFNKKYERVGHIFQGIYKSKIVQEDSYLIQLTAYIHLNPSSPFDWRYSSLPAYLGKIDDGLSKPQMIMEMHKLTPDKYKDFLKNNYSSENLETAKLTFEETEEQDPSVKGHP